MTTKRDEFLHKSARLASIGLGLGGVLFLFIFGTFFYQYSWTSQRQFVSLPYMAVYYGVPLALAVLLFWSLRLHPIARINLVVAIVSASVSMYAAELYVDLTDSSRFASTKPVMLLLEDSKDKAKEAAALSRQSGGAIDTRTAAEVLADLQRTDADAVPIMTPHNHLFVPQADQSVKSAISIDGQEVMPLAPVSNRDTLLCNESGQWIRYRSDEHGFNNPSEIWRAERLEIAALGDSYTQGYCVPGDANFVELIRQHHPITLNLGVAGDGPLLTAATLKEYLPHLRPRTVLWFYFEGNDLLDLPGEMKSPLLRNYLKDGFTQPALARQNDIDHAILGEIPRLRAYEEGNRAAREANALSGRVNDFVRLSGVRQRLGIVGGVERGVFGEPEGPTLGVFRRILLQSKVQVEGWGGQLVFVYLPEWSRYTSFYSPGRATQSRVLTLVRDLGIPIVDISVAFEAHGDPLSFFPFRRSGHYNERGHRVVAEEVLKTLSQRQGEAVSKLIAQ